MNSEIFISTTSLYFADNPGPERRADADGNQTEKCKQAVIGDSAQLFPEAQVFLELGYAFGLVDIDAEYGKHFAHGHIRSLFCTVFARS